MKLPRSALCALLAASIPSFSLSTTAEDTDADAPSSPVDSDFLDGDVPTTPLSSDDLPETSPLQSLAYPYYFYREALSAYHT
eukprot:CAMPEP_0182513036 /NCGR_PEP_ID=MMETSP1321-20130603/33271_1 /TAXON_ID=91990 /ORGANISM="Bolidomonas sp., Strain RCC1657" /LENGTH=81 /DNA_ID=CAMNT_0024719975 /DNA_START=30 /DNA_END=271 /DNA_ORIENTATION=-